MVFAGEQHVNAGVDGSACSSTSCSSAPFQVAVETALSPQGSPAGKGRIARRPFPAHSRVTTRSMARIALSRRA